MKELPIYQKSQARNFSIWLISLVVLLALCAVISLFPEAFVILIFLGLPLGLFSGAIWFGIKKLSQSQNGQPIRSVIRWSLFGWGGIYCTFTGSLILGCPQGGGGGSPFSNSSIIFGLPYTLACFGFIQFLGGIPFTLLPRNWNKLAVWRRLSLVAFIGGTVCLLILWVYFEVMLDKTCTNAVQPLE